VTTSPTPLSEVDVARIRRFAERRIPARARHQVRLEVDVDGLRVTIIERRAPFSIAIVGPEWSSHSIAQLRFSPTSQMWSLHWRDAEMDWHRYEGVGPFRQVEPLLAEIDADPMARFWG
jgi:hypothetical protein